MDFFSVLNYQGSKKNLIDFIHESSSSTLKSGETLLDIFSGTCSVGYSFKSKNRVFANDCEEYAFHISGALLLNFSKHDFEQLENDIEKRYLEISKKQNGEYRVIANKEKDILTSESMQELKTLYSTMPSVWLGNVPTNSFASLFTSYYASTYFGIGQSLEIDALRLVIGDYYSTPLYSALLTSLYFAMKECVFAKDGHMAQPLDMTNYFLKLLRLRGKSIFTIFIDKFSEFFKPSFVCSQFDNRTFNLPFEQLIELPEIRDEVDVIYADPPYTDMQYSRYYHLLNFITRYEQAKPTLVRGAYTKGLYTEGRYQSSLSAKGSCLDSFAKLVKFSKKHGKRLIVSFAYPADTDQKTDRYVMSIADLIGLCQTEFGTTNVDVVDCDYLHSNNRNSVHKKVREYLIMCK